MEKFYIVDRRSYRDRREPAYERVNLNIDRSNDERRDKNERRDLSTSSNVVIVEDEVQLAKEVKYLEKTQKCEFYAEFDKTSHIRKIIAYYKKNITDPTS